MVIPSTRGTFLLPEHKATILLNPMERTLFRLFINHPEGIASENLLLHWQELCDIYALESCYENNSTREAAMESLCAESRHTFYTNISRIKQKYVKALGVRKASGYIIKRGKDGLYKTSATLIDKCKSVAF